MSEAVVFEDFSAELAGREVLRRVSFAVASGEVAAVFGRTGSGKSCIALALCDRLTGCGGSARILGRDVAVTFKTPVNRPISIGFQSPCYAPELTVQENLELQSVLWRTPRRKRTGRIAFLMQLLGLEPLQRVRAGKLSDGQKRALEIARALLPETPVVVLDSLLDHIDPDIRNKLFRNLFDSANREKSAFLIATRDAEIAELCDRVVLLDSGRALAADSPENLRANAPDEIVVTQTADNPVLRRRIAERFQVVVREENGGLVFSHPNADLVAAELLSELESQVTCVRVRRQSLYEIVDSLSAEERRQP
ncbi:MAG: ABC transporter ATP-binding protein [Armatimonadota bacterium]|nr:ABC transporter ATP-binding protein [Armatimonadota bacterium]